jgi:hypothetical protein
MDDVLDDLAVPLQLLAKANGEVPCGRGVASGEDGVFVIGKGDIRACAATNGDFPELDLFDKQNLLILIRSVSIYTQNFIEIIALCNMRSMLCCF